MPQLLKRHARRLCSMMLVLGATDCTPRRALNSEPGREAAPPSLRWLSGDAALAEAAGARSAAVIVAEAGAVGDRFTRVVDIDEKQCVLLMARGSERVADIDLYAYSEDGTALAIDDRVDPKPTLLLCPPHPRHIYVTARIATGQGMIAVGLQSVPLDRSRRVQATLRAVPQPDTRAGALDAGIADVERRLRDHLQDLGGRWTAVAQTTVAVDSRIPSLTGLVVEAGTCLDAFVLAPLTISGLDVEALDTEGRTLGRFANTEQDQSIVACAQEQRPFSLQLRPHDGNGTVLVLVSRGSLLAGRATEHPIELSPSKAIGPLVDEVHRELRARQQGIGQRIAQTTLVRGEQYRIDDAVQPGCTRFDVFAGAPSRNVEARAYFADGELVSSNRGSQYLPLLVCGRGKISLVFDTQTAGGPLWVEKTPADPTSVPAAVSPRAAARIFLRASQLGLPLEWAELRRVRPLTFGPKRNWEQQITITPGQCLDAFAALEDEPAVIRLHQIDPDTGESTDGEQHPDSAHLLLCCPVGAGECKDRVQVTANAAAKGLFAAILHR